MMNCILVSHSKPSFKDPQQPITGLFRPLESGDKVTRLL